MLELLPFEAARLARAAGRPVLADMLRAGEMSIHDLPNGGAGLARRIGRPGLARELAQTHAWRGVEPSALARAGNMGAANAGHAAGALGGIPGVRPFAKWPWG